MRTELVFQIIIDKIISNVVSSIKELFKLCLVSKVILQFLEERFSEMGGGLNTWDETYLDGRCFQSPTCRVPMSYKKVRVDMHRWWTYLPNKHVQSNWEYAIEQQQWHYWGRTSEKIQSVSKTAKTEWIETRTTEYQRNNSYLKGNIRKAKEVYLTERCKEMEDIDKKNMFNLHS